MSCTPFASPLALLFACAACALAPAASSAQDGGSTYGSPTQAAPAQGDAGTLTVSRAVILGHTLHVRGTMAHGQPGRPVTVQRQGKDGRWIATATATTAADGVFDASWTTDHIGRFPLRAVPAPTPGASAASVPATGVTPVTVYHKAVATFFGPGFFGRQTACGQTLTTATLGVAHRSLPCGTPVALYYRGRTITVPVIDRGPFRKGTTWDLTSATATAIGMDSTASIGAVRLPRGA